MLASDNASGIHPAVLERLAEVNRSHALAYGADPYTAQAERVFRDCFGDQVSVFMVGTGTASNVLALQAMAQSVDAVLCADCAHLLVDECGAPERMIGCKMVGLPTRDGRLDMAGMDNALAFHSGMVHRNRPRVLSLSQATERGTLYSLADARRLADGAHAHGLHVHMDGARLANAAVALGVSLKEASGDLGVDILSFGGTKNGLMMAEAIVVFDPALAEALPSIRKQGMQLASKQRFLAAQFLAYLEDDLWRRNALHANRMAARLVEALSAFERIRITSPVQANMVFARLPPEWIAPLQRHTYFNVWDPEASEVRFVTSFDTTEQDIEAFADEAARLATKENMA